MTEARGKLVGDSYSFCFRNYYTLDETIGYMKKNGVGDIHTEEKTTEVYNAMLEAVQRRNIDYRGESEKRSAERRMLTQEDEWTTQQKMDVLKDRLSILSKNKRKVVKKFTQLEKETLCFFISKDFLTKEGLSPYERSGTHKICFHCHCLVCYSKFTEILNSLPNRNLVEKLMADYDEAKNEDLKDDEMQMLELEKKVEENKASCSRKG